MLNRFKLNTISTNSLKLTIIVITIVDVDHGAGQEKYIFDIEQSDKINFTKLSVALRRNPEFKALPTKTKIKILNQVKTGVYGLKMSS